MKKIVHASLALVLSANLPGIAAAERLSREELIVYAMEKDVCGDVGVSDAYYVDGSSNQVKVICGRAGGAMAMSEGIGAGGAAAAGLLVLLAIGAGGGGGGTPATTGTN